MKEKGIYDHIWRAIVVGSILHVLVDQNIVNYVLCASSFLIKSHPVGFSSEQHAVVLHISQRSNKHADYSETKTHTHAHTHRQLSISINMKKTALAYFFCLDTQFLFKHIPLLLKSELVMCRCLVLVDKEHPPSLD